MAAGMLESSRRGFVKQGLGLGMGLAGATAGEAVAEMLAGHRPRSLSASEIEAVKALMARLIPADPQSGGAVEAGAHVYLDRALETFHASHLPAYRAALAGLDAIARSDGHAALAAMPADALDGLIGRMERGELSARGLPQGGKAFFNLIRRHSLEGFLSDPIYGGNQDFLGWKVIGFHGVQLWHSAEHQRLNAPDERPQRSIGDYGGRPIA